MNEIFKIYGSILLKDEAFIKGLQGALDKAEQTKNQMAQKFQQVGDTFNRIGQGISRTGGVLTGTLTTGILGLAGAGVKYNMEMENFHMNLTTLLGSSEKATKLLDDLKEMAATTPFETNDLIDATQTMIGFGIASDDAQKYLGYIGDIAMGDANKLSGLSLAFSQVQSTGKLTGQDLLQMVNQGFNPLKYISEMTGKSMAKLKEEMSEGKITAEMVGDAFEYATSKGQPFYQGMENGAKTVSGRISTLKDNFMILIGNLTESLLPTFEKIVDGLTKLVEKFSNLDQEQKEQILKWAGIVAAIGPALIIFGKVTSGIGGIFTVVGKLLPHLDKMGINFKNISKLSSTMLHPIKALKSGFGTLKTTIASKLLPSIQGMVMTFNASGGGLSGVLAVAKTGVMSFGSALGGLATTVAPVIAIIVAIVGVVYVLKEHWDKVTQTFKNFAENIGLTEKLQEIKDKLQPLWEKIKGLKDLLLVVGTAIIGGLTPAIGVLMGLFNAVLSAISPLIDALGGIIDILAGIGTFIISVFKGDWEKAWESVKKIGSGIVDVFSGLWGAVKGILKGFVDGVVGFFKGLWDTLVGHSIVPDTINSIIDWFKDLLGKPIQFVKDLKDKVVNFFGNLKDKAIEKAKGLVDGAKEKFNSMKTAVVNKAQEIKDGAVNKFNEMKTNASNKFNELKSSASEKFNSIKSTISDKLNQAKSKAVDLFQQMNTASGGKLGNLASTVSSKFSDVYNKIKDKMNSAKEKVTSIISSMTSAFKKFAPKLKMPHIKITGSWDLKNLKFPKFSVDWYAKGGIFDQPTIFPTASGLKGVGEAGPEAVTPISALQKYVQVAVDNSNTGLEQKLDVLTDVLLKYMPLLLERQLVLDSGEMVGALTSKIDKSLGDLADKKGRGR